MKGLTFDRAVDGFDAGVYKHKLRDESYVLRVLWTLVKIWMKYNCCTFEFILFFGIGNYGIFFTDLILNVLVDQERKIRIFFLIEWLI